ncbi:uncharacterized protein BDR25DRAFT_249957 [Lindgomyces ingoldianus]|uniref:Uncharacterized protein n=1 Tax=Lindgomyces ingoldianus TaxID=673940 RepID=A0ACB6RET8_9PLEO|nr:uncharacterized protein BDR25DRAFT_249957 [Lindgomyces ingoldianus]KAF2477764.1 hypothetical protein BDR25DRAFT_249957 [Lindgomyces ingoldianus]
MDIVLQAQFQRVEAALSTLVDSIASYNPNLQAAVDLVAADDELGKGLEQLAHHQVNHARILSLRNEVDTLEAQLKTSISTLADLRCGLLDTPATTVPESSKPVPFGELLRYARNISRYTVPPTYREPIPKGDSDVEKEKDKEETASGSVPSNGLGSPIKAGNLVPTDQAAKDTTVSGEEHKQVTAEQAEWLTRLHESGVQWVPWPSHEKIRAGGLMAIQHMVDRGLDPTTRLLPAEQEAEDKRKQEEAVLIPVPEESNSRMSPRSQDSLPLRTRSKTSSFTMDNREYLRIATGTNGSNVTVEAAIRRIVNDPTTVLIVVDFLNAPCCMNESLKTYSISCPDFFQPRLRRSGNQVMDYPMRSSKYSCETCTENCNPGSREISKVLVEINTTLKRHESIRLQSILVIEPPFDQVYTQLISEIRQRYPGSHTDAEDKLQPIVKGFVTETHEEEPGDGDDLGGIVPSWGSMVSFLSCWLLFLRDVDPSDLLKTYERLNELQTRTNSALLHPTKGILILPTLIGYAKVFARVAIGLDKHPELIAHLVSSSLSEEGQSETLPEKAANVIRQAFSTCLNDRYTVPGGVKNNRPDGKKIGIYRMANLCLKILFQCDKLDNCQQIFNNIFNSSPPLSIYPASDRVTYLYYLGRYHFSKDAFFPAQLALQKAYDDCNRSPQFQHQRRLILIYLITANLILGRFPSEETYSRIEAAGLRKRFEPITRAIRKGDLENFRRLTSLNHEYAPWFLHFRIFYQIENYCEVQVWRTLFRKVFIHFGETGASERSAPTLDLWKVLAAFYFYEKRALMSESMAQADAGPGKRHISFIFQENTPPSSAGYVDPDFDGLDLKPEFLLPDILEMESIASSLISQGFMNGFISHKQKRFAITGARRAGSAVKAGWPNFWNVIVGRSSDEVMGWRKDTMGSGGGGSFGPGRVVRLSGVKAAGE